MRQAGRLEELYADYGDRAAFVVVYIREAHASDGPAPLRRRGPRIKDPRTLVDRQRVAKQCARAVKFSMPMVIDELSDVAARAYGGFPDRLYIVGKDGRIAYKGRRGPWGFKPDELEERLKLVLKRGGSLRVERI